MIKKDKNTPEIWNKIWSENNSHEEDNYNFNKAKKSIHWTRMKKILKQRFGDLKNLNVIEIGAGSGMYSLILASEGANVTLLDYSPKAIEVSRLLFKYNNIKANFIQENALSINKNLLRKFDVSMSFGTAEHFYKERRLKFIKVHLAVLKKGGIAFISVPNKWNLPYLMHKFLSELFGKWNFGEEYPFSQREFNKIGRKLNCHFKFIGHTLFSDPFLIKLRIKRMCGISQNFDIKNIKKEIGTPLDKYFANGITAVAQKYNL